MNLDDLAALGKYEVGRSGKISAMKSKSCTERMHKVRSVFGSRHDQKAVYNVLNYLARSGRLKRIGRGHYLVIDVGVTFQVGHDLEDADAHGGGCMES